MLSRIRAWRWKRRALRDMQRQLDSLDQFDADFWRQPSAHVETPFLPAPTERTRRGPRLGAGSAGLLITALLLGGVVAFSPGSEMATVRRLIGMEPSGPGDYAFLQTQPSTGRPVGYSPCRTIEVVINPDGAPGSYRELVETAIDHVSEHSGLEFEVVGTTTDRLADHRSGSDVHRPVLVSWADSDEVPGLEGRIAGLGGSTAYRISAGILRYGTGAVTLDTDVFTGFRAASDASQQAIVDHEFGHLVGLDHVDDANELMHGENTGRTTWGPGDIAGLERLGDLPC